jgi:hypothetical protein
MRGGCLPKGQHVFQIVHSGHGIYGVAGSPRSSLSSAVAVHLDVSRPASVGGTGEEVAVRLTVVAEDMTSTLPGHSAVCAYAVCTRFVRFLHRTIDANVGVCHLGRMSNDLMSSKDAKNIDSLILRTWGVFDSSRRLRQNS